MPKKKGGKKRGRSDRKGKTSSPGKRKRSVRGALRQLAMPPEFRIELAPGHTVRPDKSEDVGSAAARSGPQGEAPAEATGSMEVRQGHYRALSEVAACLWYLKTRYFGKEWNDGDPDADDPRDRRALGRLAKGVEALSSIGIEVHDPINARYPVGGEGMMRPVQLDPTPGITVAVVTETVRPIVYLGDRLLQRGEVFVATPVESVDGDVSARRDSKITPQEEA